MTRRDVLVIGAGASGLFCAAQCAVRGRKVAVLDHSQVCGRKVRISGGGRCNATNLNASAHSYVCSNPHFVKSALARYTPRDFLAFLDRRGVGYAEEDQGRIFARKAGDVAEALRVEAVENGVELLLGVGVHGARTRGGGLVVDTDQGEYHAASLVVATGGLSWPQIGATNLGFQLAESFGLKVTPLRPGLVPLLALDDLKGLCADLAGISLPVRIKLPQGPAAQGSLLFTHKGISGPAVLDASLVWTEGQGLSLDLLPDTDLEQVFAGKPRMEVRNVLKQLLPRRVASALCERHGWGGVAGELSKKAATNMAGLLHGYPFTPSGTAGFGKAEVTVGGVDTANISSKTMECCDVPGLYFIGEVLDVTGRLDGYNLQWAWASGFAAGQFA